MTEPAVKDVGSSNDAPSRRLLIGAALAGAVQSLWTPSWVFARALEGRGASPLSLTPTCPGLNHPTPRDDEGPFYKPASPERSRLAQGLTGVRLSLTGRVFGLRCQPLAGVSLDWWQADKDGVYDLKGERLRGREYTASDGLYRLETIIPRWYSAAVN